MTSRACELTTIREHDENLGQRNKEFTETAKRFLVYLSRVKEIEPLSKTLCLESDKIIGIRDTADGVVPG